MVTTNSELCDTVYTILNNNLLNLFVCSVNNILLDLMEQQFDQLVSTCPSADFTFLRLIKSLYVLKLHGRDRYFL